MSEKLDKDGNVIKEVDNTDLNVNDDGLSDDDYFEKLLSENGGGDGDDGTGNIKKDDKPTREELEAENEKLKKEAKGRLTDTIKSRQERSAMKTELVELRGAVTQLFSKRDSLNGEEKKTPKALEDPKKKIEFEADESAFVDLGEVKTAIKESKDSTQEQIDELKQLTKDQVQKSEYERTVSNILDVNRAEFDPAYRKLQEAVKSLNDKVIEAQNRTDTLGDPKTGELTVDAALDLIDGSVEEEAFKKDYPGLNPTQIARAFNSKRDLKDTLTQIATTLKSDTKNKTADNADMDLIRRAQKKPGSLGGQDNQSGAGETLLDKISNLPSESIMDISDAEADRIEKLMLDEELRGE